MAIYEAFLAGVPYTNRNGSSRKQIAHNCEEGNPLFLMREHDNPFDANAIAVLRNDFEQLGYVEASVAKVLGPQMDEGTLFWCEIESIRDQSDLQAPPPRIFLSVKTSLGTEFLFVAGTAFSDETFEGEWMSRAEVARDCEAGEPMLLARESNNSFDHKAIAVHTQAGWKVGYLERSAARWIAPLMDADEEVTACIEHLEGGRQAPRILLTIFTEEEIDEWFDEEADCSQLWTISSQGSHVDA